MNDFFVALGVILVFPAVFLFGRNCGEGEGYAKCIHQMEYFGYEPTVKAFYDEWGKPGGHQVPAFSKNKE